MQIDEPKSQVPRIEDRVMIRRVPRRPRNEDPRFKPQPFSPPRPEPEAEISDTGRYKGTIVNVWV